MNETKIIFREDCLESFSKHKLDSVRLQEMIADSLEWAGKDKKAWRVRQCGNLLIFKRYPELDNLRKLETAAFCKNSLCPYCQWRKSLRRSQEIKRALMQIEETERGNLHFVTLTTTNKEYLTRDFLQKFAECGREFVKTFFETKNYISSVEITYTTEKGYHPHMHILLLTEKEIKLRKKSMLRFSWAECLKSKGLINKNVNWQMADVKEATVTAANEIGKYITKIVAIDVSREEIFDVIDCLVKATAKINLWSVSGVFREYIKKAKKSLEKDRREEDDYLGNFKAVYEYYLWFQDNYKIILE